MKNKTPAIILALTGFVGAACGQKVTEDDDRPEDSPLVPGGGAGNLTAPVMNFPQTPYPSPYVYPYATPGAAIGYPGYPAAYPGVLPAPSVAYPGGDEWSDKRVKSGNRLRAIHTATSDGQRYFQFEWFDAAINARCRFALAADGQSRCLPLPPQQSINHGLVRYYRDGNCGEPLLPANNGCGTNYGSKSASGLVSIHRLGPVGRVDRAFALQVNEQGKLVCRATEVVGARDFFTLGDAVPPETFVGTASNGAEPVSGRRIWPIVRTGADGMRVRTGWWDNRFGQECTVRRGFDGNYRCMPQLAFASPLSSFADPSCTQPAAVSSTSPDGTMVRVVESNICPARETLYRTEVLLNATTVYRRSATGCAPVTVPAGAKVFAVRQMVPHDEFVAFTEARVGATRLQQRVLTSVEGSIERPSYPLDTAFADACAFTRSETGRVHCMPVPAEPVVGAEMYGDQGCYSRIARPALGLGCAQAQHASLVDGSWCAPFVRTKLLGGSAIAFRRGAGGTCQQALYDGSYRSLGTDVNLGSFIEGVDVME